MVQCNYIQRILYKVSEITISDSGAIFFTFLEASGCASMCRIVWCYVLQDIPSYGAIPCFILEMTTFNEYSVYCSLEIVWILFFVPSRGRLLDVRAMLDDNDTQQYQI